MIAARYCRLLTVIALLVIAHVVGMRLDDGGGGACPLRESRFLGLAPTAASPGADTPMAALRLPRLPLAFVPNQGQWDGAARFEVRHGALTLRIEPAAFALRLLASSASGSEPKPLAGREAVAAQGSIVRLSFEGGNRAAAVEPGCRLPGQHNYFLGADPARWRVGVPLYADVTCRDLYPGIDITLHESSAGEIEYDLLLESDADPAAVIVRCEGHDSLRIDQDGSLVLSTPAGELRQRAPISWEESADGVRRPLACNYRLIDAAHFGIEVPDWSRASRLTIDPGLIWSTYLGSAGGDRIFDVAVADEGSIVVCGNTNGADFPTQAGAFDPVKNFRDVFVSALTPDGEQLEYSTFLGGAGEEFADGGLALGEPCEVTIAGITTSSDFPVSPGAFDREYAGGPTHDTFVARLGNCGSSLIFGTYLGGACNDNVRDCALAAEGTVLLAGNTCSHDFPTTPGAIRSVVEGGLEVFVSRVAADGSALLSSTLLGGDAAEQPYAVAAEPGGTVLVAGTTVSTDFPTTPGVLQEASVGHRWDGFLTRISEDATAIEMSTLLGGDPTNLSDAGIGEVIVQPDGSLLLGGGTGSPTFPTTPGAYLEAWPPGAQGSFVSRISSDGSRVLTSTLVDFPFLLGCVMSDGSVIGFGPPDGPDMPVTPGAHDTENSPPYGSVGFLSRLDPALAHVTFGSYIGQPSAASLSMDAVAVAEDDSVIVVGGSPGTTPGTAGAFDPSYNGAFYDGFVLRLALFVAWTDLGGGVDGVAGVPILVADGILEPGNSVSLALSAAAAHAPTFSVLGASVANIPLKGGWLVPAPDLILAWITDGSGSLVLTQTCPAGLASGWDLFAQFWVADSSASLGFAASNALQLTTP